MDTTTAIKLPEKSIAYQKKVLNPWLFKLGFGTKLPSVVWWGITVKTLNAEKCDVTLPFNWRSQNPFKSIYFSALAGAAELATGALCQMYIVGLGEFSMLVTGFRAEFYKKANTTTTFTCDQGSALSTLLQSMQNPGDTGELEMIATGRNEAGDIVAKAFVKWSFKRKN
jgi:hypothetical protein